MADVVFFQPFMFGAALAEQMSFNLIDGGNNFVKFDQIDQPVRIKVRYADGPDFPFLIQLFQFLPSGIVVPDLST